MYNYRPANATGGPRSIGRIAPSLLNKEDLEHNKQGKRSTHLIPEDCDSQVTLYSSSEMSAAAILAPGVGVAMNYHTIKRITCALIK